MLGSNARNTEEVYWKTIEYAKETARAAWTLKNTVNLRFLKMNSSYHEIMETQQIFWKKRFKRIKIHSITNRLESHIIADSKRFF